MIKAIKGVKDLLPEETPRWRLIEGTAKRWALCYGFQEIRVPIFETTTLFARSIGATTDSVEKEPYTFDDRDGTSLPSSNITGKLILGPKNIIISAPCFGMSGPRPADYDSFISSVWNPSEFPIRVPM